VSEPIITVTSMTRRFGTFTAVDDVSFHVEEGEIFGYLGANGAGKSTTIRMLCGLLAPTSGDAIVAGHRISTAPESVKASIGYMSQRFSLYLDLPVKENLEFFGGAYGLSGAAFRARRDEVLKLVDLGPFLDVITGQLPGGTRQRLALCCSLLHRPRVVFLDEPTAGVDPGVRREFWSLIRGLSRSGVAVFVTTHYMDEAEYCARIGLMVDGQLRALDTPTGLKRAWVPGRILVIEGTGLAAGVPRVRALPGVRAVEPFGAAWHVRFDEAICDARAVLAAFAAHGATNVRTGEGEATLEDVFLSVVARPEASSPEPAPAGAVAIGAVPTGAEPARAEGEAS
jgi:ABC-2 type transport system ATP-binding protein